MSSHDDAERPANSMTLAADEPFRRLVESAPDGVVISRDGVILYANPAAAALLGYESGAHLAGRPLSVFLDPGSITIMRRRIQQMRETGERLLPREYPAKRRDGSVITAEIASILSEWEGQPAVLAFARDVTERGRLRAQLAHAERLASLGVMAVGIAHEINNPLAAVSLVAEKLGRRLAATDPDLVGLAKEVEHGVHRIARIVRDLRTFGRFEDEPAGRVHLPQVLEAAERIVSHELRPRARLAWEVDADLPAVLGVATRLEQVFVNLLLNAALSMPEDQSGGIITVRAHAGAHEVVIEVIDNGEGVASENLDRIFEPFFTTRPSGGGTGLGLSICRELVAQVGGSIVALSELGKGTTMRVTLRRAADGSVAARRTAPPLGSARRISGKRILVIDDEPHVVAAVTGILGDDNDVIGETDAEAALDRLLKDAAFDAVVCDLMMPHLTGMDIFERVSRERPGLEARIIFATGGAYTPRAKEFLEKSSNHFLMKPFSAQELQALLSSVPRHLAPSAS